MKSSRSKALVVATVTGIQDAYVIYPYCTVCYGKLNKNCHFNKWICIQCQISYESGCIPYRYCLRLNIADETSYCSTSVFGKTLQPYFGLAANEMQKILDLQHSDQIMEALKKTFVGKCFIFEFNALLLNKKNSSNLCLLSVIKKNGNSLFGSNVVAYQIISNSSTNNDTVYSYLMQSSQLTYSKMPKINKSHSLQTTEIIDFESSISHNILSYDSTSQESIVLSRETKQSECQNLKIPLTALSSYKSSSSPFLIGSSHCKVRELTLPDKKISLSFFYHLNFDKNKSLFKEPNQTLFSSKQLQFLFTETSANIKTDFKNESKRKKILCLHFENISISEMYKDEIENFGNTIDLDKAISVKLNQSRKSVSHIESEDLATILNDFDERICECSLKFIDTCKQYFIQKSSIIQCSANSSLYSLEYVNNFIKKLSELTNTYSSTAGNLSGDLFETVSEETSSFSEKCNASNHCRIFLTSTPNLQNENEIMSFYRKPKKSLLLCSHTPNKVFCHLLDDSNDSQFFCSTQSHTERKSNVSVMIPAPELQRREKQIDNSKTVFSQNKVNKQRTVIFRQNDSYQCSKSTESKRNVKKCKRKTNLTCLPFKSCTFPVSSFNRLSSKSSVSKIKTNIYQKTFASTPKNCSPQLYDAFGTPIQRTDFIQEGIYCDSPSLLQKKSPHFHGFVTKSSPEQNEVSFDLFTPSNDSHESLSLSLQVSTKKINEFSPDLFSQESNQSPISSISKYFNKNNYMTPVSLKSSGQYLTHSKKNYHCLTKRNILQKADGFINSTYNKEQVPLNSEIKENL